MVGAWGITTGEPRFVDRLGDISAGPDREFVLVPVALRNFGAEALTYNRFDFLLDSGQGDPVSPSVVHSVESQLQVGEVEPAATIVGLLPFEIPRGARGLSLLFSPLCDPPCAVQRLPLTAAAAPR
jgi:hypothetical protein